MIDMAINKVEYAGNTLIDLTADTVTPETLAEGVTAHDKAGNLITGTMTSGGSGQINMGTCTVIVDPPSSSNYYIGRETVSGGEVVYNITRSYTSNNITVKTRCDSLMYIIASTIKGAAVTDGEVLKLTSGYGIAYQTPSTDGVSVTVTLS